MLPEMLAAGLNANMGGRDQVPLEVEHQVVRWIQAIFGFPESAADGDDVRSHGVAANSKRLTAYALARAVWPPHSHVPVSSHSVHAKNSP